MHYMNKEQQKQADKADKELWKAIRAYARYKPKDAIERKQKAAFFNPYCHGFKKPLGW
jgi:hypothetical protein